MLLHFSYHKLKRLELFRTLNFDNRLKQEVHAVVLPLQSHLARIVRSLLYPKSDDLSFVLILGGHCLGYSYYNVAPSCECAGPLHTDYCTGEPCPMYTMETEDGECPALCTSDWKGVAPPNQLEIDTACATPCVDCNGADCTYPLDDYLHDPSRFGDGTCDYNSGAGGFDYNCPVRNCRCIHC